MFAIPTIGYTSSPRVLITTLSENPVNITLSAPGLSNKQCIVNRNTPADIPLPSGIRMDRNIGKQNKTIIIRSSGLVSVHAIDDDKGGGDGFLVYSSTQLGTRYYVSAYETAADGYSFFCVTPLEDSVITVVTNTGQTITEMLRQYESYRFDQDFDLSGTLIQSDKRISVTSGAWTEVPVGECCIDGLLEMLLPVSKWGKKHFLAPIKGLSISYVYRVYSSNISTTLKINDGRSNSSITLRPFENVHEEKVVEDVMVSISSDQPIMVVKYIKGHYLNNPAMIIVPPLTSFTGNVTFPVIRYNTAEDRHEYYINVIIGCSMMTGLRFFGPQAGTRIYDEIYFGDHSMCCARSAVSPGQHFVSHNDSNALFSVSVYAIADTVGVVGVSSYAYLANGGTNLKSKSD